jgi:hypothetical protein
LFELDARYKSSAAEDFVSETTNAINSPTTAAKVSIAGQRFITTYGEQRDHGLVTLAMIANLPLAFRRQRSQH